MYQVVLGHNMHCTLFCPKSPQITHTPHSQTLVLLIVVMEVHQNRGIKVFERRNAVGSIIIKFCNATGPTITNSVSLLVLVLLAHVFFQVLHILWSMCVFFPSILDIKFVGRTSRGHTGGRSHRIFNPPSFCGACLDFCREKDSAIPFPRRP